MPTYSFRCDAGDVFDAVFSMSEVPDTTVCLHCESQARRVPPAPFLSQAGSSAYGLIDQAARSAHEPQVVSGSLPGASRATPTRYTTNPLHAKLPRT